MRYMVYVLIKDVFGCGGVNDGTDFAINVRVVEDWWLRLIVDACLSVALLVRCWCDVYGMSVVDGSQLDRIDGLKSSPLVRALIGPNASSRHCWRGSRVVITQ